MGHGDLLPTAQIYINGILLWIGFATVTGFVVRAVIPGKEPSGPLGTFLIGVAGSCFGPMALTLFFNLRSETFNPIGLLGFFSSVSAAAVVLILFRAYKKVHGDKAG